MYVGCENTYCSYSGCENYIVNDLCLQCGCENIPCVQILTPYLTHDLQILTPYVSYDVT